MRGTTIVPRGRRRLTGAGGRIAAGWPTRSLPRSTPSPPPPASRWRASVQDAIEAGGGVVGYSRLIEENGVGQGVFLFEHSRHRRSLILTSIGEGGEATASRLMRPAPATLLLQKKCKQAHIPHSEGQDIRVFINDAPKSCCQKKWMGSLRTQPFSIPLAPIAPLHPSDGNLHGGLTRPRYQRARFRSRTADRPSARLA